MHDSNEPKYYIDAFNKDADSNKIIFEMLLNNKTETIESIINKINQNHTLKLSLDNRPFIKDKRRSSTTELSVYIFQLCVDCSVQHVEMKNLACFRSLVLSYRKTKIIFYEN